MRFVHEALQLSPLPHLQVGGYLPACMQPHFCQLRHVDESFPTGVAVIRLLTSAGSSHVDCRVPTVPCFSSTLTCMNRNVLFQVLQSTVSFPTGAAVMRLFARVRSHVDFHVTLKSEFFPTRFA